MSQAAAAMLASAYGVDERQLEIVPHGVPNLPLVDPDTIKPRLDLEGRSVILSFGLLGPGKGYESAIAAMPAVVKAIPSAVYVILGATHPDLLLREGEAYRERLVAAAAEAGVTDHVRFIDRFVGRVELGTWLEAADVFVTPYPNMDLTCPGPCGTRWARARGSCHSLRLRQGASGARPGSPRGSRVLGGKRGRVIDLLGNR